jgi:hypothetical protein
MPLAPEDLLRLNVLLAQQVEAIRIDERDLTLRALLPENEVQVILNPDCRPERYLRRLREFLSGHVLDSPGGYPVYLQRWAGMGQARGQQLDRLLLLGEPDAVAAVATSGEITAELARRTWWCQPTADNARRLLHHAVVAQSPLGHVLADFLVELLPFETDHMAVIATLALVLRPGLADDALRRRLWARGNQRNAYHLGFMAALPDGLPEPVPARNDYQEVAGKLETLARSGNTLAARLTRALAAPGQSFLAECAAQLHHPLDKFTTAVLLNVIGEFFREPCGQEKTPNPLFDRQLAQLAAALPDLRADGVAIMELARTSEALAMPIMSQTTAGGTLLRRKLEPVTRPLLASIATLRRSGSA